MRQLKTTFAVLGAVTILVLAGNTIALATTGHAFILGRTNSADRMTSLTRTTIGPALRVATKSSHSAPFVVNGLGKVTNLNADSVDGLDSSVLRNHSYVFTKNIGSAVGSFDVSVPVPVGSYQFSYSAFLVGATSTNVFCEIERIHNSSSTFLAVTQFTSGTFTPGLAGAGAVVKSAGDTINFECGSSGTFTTQANVPIQLVMTPTNIVSNGALRTSARAGLRTAAH